MKLGGMPSRRVLIVLVLIALAFRGTLLVTDHDTDHLGGLSLAGAEVARAIVDRGEWFRTDTTGADALATAQAEAEVLIDPEDFDYPPPAGTRAELITPHGTALILAASWELTGSERYIWLQILQILIGAGLTVVVAWISAKLFKRPRAAAIAAALWALSPGLAFYSIVPMYEIWAAYGAVAITALYLYARETGDWRWLALVGLAVAVGTLFRQSLLFLLPAFAIAELPDWQRSLRGLGVMVAACVIGLIPWTVRSIIEFDQPRPVNGTSGQVLWQGLGDDPVFGAVNDDGLTYEMVVAEKPALSYGTPEYDDYLRSKALDAIADHPGAWVQVLGERVVDVTVSNRTAVPMPLITESDNPTERVVRLINRAYPKLVPLIDPALFLLAVAGGAFIWIQRSGRRALLFLTAVYIALLLPSILVSGHQWRYVAPALFVLMILGGVGLDAAISTTARRLRRTPQR